MINRTADTPFDNGPGCYWTFKKAKSHASSIGGQIEDETVPLMASKQPEYDARRSPTETSAV